MSTNAHGGTLVTKFERSMVESVGGKKRKEEVVEQPKTQDSSLSTLLASQEIVAVSTQIASGNAIAFGSVGFMFGFVVLKRIRGKVGQKNGGARKPLPDPKSASWIFTMEKVKYSQSTVLCCNA
jgi:hypothetical protein